MILSRARDRCWTHWRNGSGRTCEIAVFPPGSRFDDFVWRISIAEIVTDGPFSSFPGVDRQFAVLQGVLNMSIDNQEFRRISADDGILVFSGDAPVTALCLTPSVFALNVMARRDRPAPVVNRIAIGAGCTVDVEGLGEGCLITSHAVRIRSETGHYDLLALDAVTARDGEALQLSADVDAAIVWTVRDLPEISPCVESIERQSQRALGDSSNHEERQPVV